MDALGKGAFPEDLRIVQSESLQERGWGTWGGRYSELSTGEIIKGVKLKVLSYQGGRSSKRGK